MPSETNSDIAEPVQIDRQMQEARFKKNSNIYFYAQMPSRMVRAMCPVNQAGLMLVKKVDR